MPQGLGDRDPWVSALALSGWYTIHLPVGMEIVASSSLAHGS